LRERLDARKQPGHRAEEEPLFSLGPRSEGGAEPCQGNGGHGPGYRWTQTPSEVQIIVIPARASAFSFDRRVSNSAGSVATTPASAPLQKDDVACRISAGRLTLRVRAGDEKGKRHAIFDDTPLWRRVRGDASFWAISDGREVHITLTKQVSEWWRCVTDNEDGGHKKIDTAVLTCFQIMKERSSRSYATSSQSSCRVSCSRVKRAASNSSAPAATFDGTIVPPFDHLSSNHIYTSRSPGETPREASSSRDPPQPGGLLLTPNPPSGRASACSR
jgi:hypothetical protein